MHCKLLLIGLLLFMMNFSFVRGFTTSNFQFWFGVTRTKGFRRLNSAAVKSIPKNTASHHKEPIRIPNLKKQKSYGQSNSAQSNTGLSIDPSKTPTLDPMNVTDSQFHDIAKFMKKTSAPRQLFTFLEDCKRCQSLTWEMTFIAAKNFQFMNRSDLILPAFDLFLKTDTHNRSQIYTNLNISQQAVNLLCRTGNLEAAVQVAKEAGALPAQEEKQNNEESIVDALQREKYPHILSDLAFASTINADYHSACSYIQHLHQLGLSLSSPTLGPKILSIFLTQANFYHIRKVIHLLLQVNGLSSYESLQLVTNYMIRRIDFVKGAVSVETLPKQEYPEVIFMGRSNVGKSSLINLITNRKKLAYTSKTAGKTSEFNYFLAQGVFGREKAAQNFYLIDLPGVGYARRSKDLRDKWRKLMSDYIQNRQHSLKCVFHLIDSRHGILESDYDCFELLSLLPPSIDYIVVFTKIDKASNRNSNAFINGVSKELLEKTKEELVRLSEGKREIPILYTSAMDRDGGVDVLSAILQRLPTIHKEV